MAPKAKQAARRMKAKAKTGTARSEELLAAASTVSAEAEYLRQQGIPVHTFGDVCGRVLGSIKATPEHAAVIISTFEPAAAEKHQDVMAGLEELLTNPDQRVRSAAQALFYHVEQDSIPRASLAKRLEFGIEPSAPEFIVFCHHEGKQFQFIEGPNMESVFEAEKRRFASSGLAEHTGRPWCRQAQIGPYKLAVRYHLFGAEPHHNEPVGATLSKTFLCATLVYARCSSRCPGLPVNAESCATCGASDTYDVAHYKMPFDYTDCTILQAGEEHAPRYSLLVFKRNEVAVRCPVVRVEPRRVDEHAQEFASEDAECIPLAWCLENAPPG